MKVDFFRHSLGPEELSAVAEALASVFLTTGAKNTEFEESFCEYLGVEHAVTTSSATAALHLAMLAFGIATGDEVITTPMSFVAASNAVLMAGATPVFVDVEPDTGLIDPALVEAAITPRTRMILPVHLYGQMADMIGLRAIADDHGLLLVEDAAHAIEAQRDGVRPGQLGDGAVFSFYATKNITCGEGGSLVTNLKDVASAVRRLRNHGMIASAAERYTGTYRHWDIDRLGWKYNMTNFQAAMLIPQLQRIDRLWARREEITQHYEEAFTSSDVQFPRLAKGNNRSARHLFTVWTDPSKRDDHLLALEAAGVGVTVNYRPIHLTTFYRERFGYEKDAFPVAESIGSRTISLPLYAELRDDELEYVAMTTASVCRRDR